MSDAHPESLSFEDTDGTMLVTESYFSLVSSDGSTVPVNGRIVLAGPNALEVRYDLASCTSPSVVVASMEVTLNFTGAAFPKITAKAATSNSGYADAQVVWSVFPSSGADWMGYGEKVVTRGTPLTNYPTQDTYVPEMSVTLGVPAQVQNKALDEFKVDWSDARSGLMSIGSFKMLSGGSGYAVEVVFDKGKTEIDPSIVTRSAAGSSIKIASYQRHTFWYGGYYWVFYAENNAGLTGSGIDSCISTDGNVWTWSGSVPGVGSVNSATGFDVAMRGGKVAVSWVDGGGLLWFQKGTILMGNKIVWDPATAVSSSAGNTVSVAITPDGACWIATQAGSIAGNHVYVFQSFDDFNSGPHWSFNVLAGSTTACDALLPLLNGNVVLIETSYATGQSSTNIGWTYFDSQTGLWSSEHIGVIGLTPGDKSNAYSAVATPDGTVYAAYLSNAGTLNLAVLYESGGNATCGIVAQSVTFPSISLDMDGTLHVFYEASSNTICHLESWSEYGSLSGWVAKTSIQSYDGTIYGITSAMTPVQFLALTWTAGTNVLFATAPLPFGTSGAPSKPWNRDGISPYGTYFSTSTDDYVSPGSGMLTLQDTDLSIASRGGLDLGATRLYIQPRYFDNATGLPWGGYGEPPHVNATPTDHSFFPDCAMGQGWGLDLPWLDDTYVGLPGGQRYVIAWGNNGNASEFENHDGVQFILRWDETYGCYDLIMSSGITYVFAPILSYQSWDYGLEMISDGRGLSPQNWFQPTGSCIYVSYESGKHTLHNLTSLADIGTTHGVGGRQITLSYNAAGYLASITRPDGGKITYNYTETPDSRYLLHNVTDPMDRVTAYDYNASADYCLASVTLPTMAKITYTYAKDTSVGTDVRSWLVTKVVLRDSSGALIRQTNVDYKTVSGTVRFVRVTQLNETGAAQGSTEYVFQQALNCQTETVKDAAGTQLSKTVIYYDDNGQPIRTDTYKGSSQSVSYSEHSAYDNWGNVIFSEDALGHDSYSSYANTRTQNSYQGGDLLTRTTPGEIFDDGFDDWSSARWVLTAQGGGTIALDGAADPPNAPSLEITKNTTGSGYTAAYHDLGSQTNDFVVDLSYMTNSYTRSSVLCARSATLPYVRVNVSSYDGHFYYWTGSAWSSQPIGTCSNNTWYNFRFVIHLTNNTYDVCIDGSRACTAVALTANGSIYRVLFQAGDGGTGVATIWVDSIKVYRGLSITINGASGYVAELYDSTDQLVNRSVTGVLAIPPGSLGSSPGYIKLYKYGNYSFSAPTEDVWGGDVYTLIGGRYSSPLTNTQTGLGNYLECAADDAWPSGCTVYGGGNWVQNANSSVSGGYYYESPYESGVDYEGFNSTSGLTRLNVSASTDDLAQYVWLTDAKLPKEIMVQYYNAAQNRWMRAYWGGDATGADLITDLSLPSALKPYSRFRVGDVPQTTGQWLKLVVKASDLGFGRSVSTVSGIITGLYGGTARWDLSSTCLYGVAVWGPASGLTVELDLDNGKTVTATSNGVRAGLDVYAAGISVFPVSGSFKVLSGSTLLYQSPWFGEIYDYDFYKYYTPEFYANQVKEDIHSREVGSFQYQDYARTISQETYLKYDSDGDNVETNASLGSRWIVSEAGYDQYGNQIWSSDPTGHGTTNEYSSADQWTYLAASSKGGPVGDSFESNQSWAWTPSINTGGGSPSWVTAQYSTDQSHSASHSIQLNFSNARGDGTDSCIATMYKECTAKPIIDLSLWMYVATYSHNNGTGESMDTGVRLRLYDSSDKNYVNYTYWLDSWTSGSNIKTPPPDRYNNYTKVVANDPARCTWWNFAMNPSTDWAIDWSRCAKLRIELYVNTTGAYGDTFKVHFDDLSSYERTTYTYDVNNGYLLSSTDALGRKTNMSYDRLGRVAWTQYADGAHTKDIYNDKANTVTVLDELNHKTVYSYDSIGRLIKVERYGSQSTNYSYVRYGYNWQDEVAYSIDELGYVTSYSYDFLGRETKVTNPDASYRTTAYDDVNSIVTSADELGHSVAHVYDNLGRLNSTQEYYSLAAFYTTQMTYDAVGNLLTVKDAKDQVTRMAYDQLNRLRKTTYPDGLFELAAYDDAGRLVQKTDRNGTVTSSSYGLTGRLAQIANPADTVSYTYDAAGQMWITTSSSGSITYTYNKRGLMTVLTQTVGSDTFSTCYGYDATGNNVWIWYQNGANITYNYDAYNRVTSIVESAPNPGTTLWTVNSYNLDDSVAQDTAGNGYTTTYAYSNRGWPTSILTKSGSTTKLGLTYVYDKVGNVKYLNQTGTFTNNENYSYDYLNRMIYAVGAWGSTKYDYSSVGNRGNKTEGGVTTAYTYLAGKYNELNKTVAGSTTWYYSYDKNGDQTWKNQSASTRYNSQFNALGQLTKVVTWTYKSKTWSSSVSGQYWYDANGMRAKTVEGSTTTEYSYLGHDPIEDKTGRIFDDYAYISSHLKVKLVGATGKYPYYYFSDALGSSRLVYNGTTVAYKVATYKPFGTPYTQTGSESVEYAGELIDPAASSSPGLYYIGARWMDSDLGRFISMDPLLGLLSLPQTQDRYVYCANGPLRYKDPTGCLIDELADEDLFGEAESSDNSAEGDLSDGGLAYDGNGELVPTDEMPATQGSGGFDEGINVNPPAINENFEPTDYRDVSVNGEMEEIPKDVRAQSGETEETAGVPTNAEGPAATERVPNPWGTIGSPAHQAAVEEIAQGIESNGLEAVKEYQVKDPQGNIIRRVDVAAMRSGVPEEFYQVGLITQSGFPIAREWYALMDIYDLTGIWPEFYPYGIQ